VRGVSDREHCTRYRHSRLMRPLGHERWESHSVWYGIRYTVEALGSCPWGTIKTLPSQAPSTREEILLDSNDGVPRDEASH
jgi:hypothetical protein